MIVKDWIPSLAAALLVAFSGAPGAQVPPGNPSDPGDQPAATPPSPSDEPAPGSTEVPESGGDAADAGPSPTSPPPAGADDPGTRLAAIVPAGLSPREACSGFKNLEECAAALHVSANLNIVFADLKSKMTAGERLTAAVQELKPGTDAKAEVRRAQEQARMDTRRAKG